MRIGLTYDLRAEYLAAGYGEEETAEFDQGETIDGLERAVRALGHEAVRIGHARQLMAQLAAGARWDLVLNIAEGMYGLGREAQVPAILDVYRIPYTFSDPLVTALCLHKGLTKLVVQAAGLPTPRFALVEQPGDARRVDLPLPLFAKPVAEGTGKGIGPTSKITDRGTLAEVCDQLLAKYRQPVLVETFLPGREMTVGILGTGDDARVVGTMEVLLGPQAEPDVYSYTNKERSEELVDYRLGDPKVDAEVRRAEEVALGAWRALGCRDGGRIDLRSDAGGEPNFLEVNPLAGMHPTHSDLPMIGRFVGMSYVELVGAILASASKRLKST